jgi:hypothetical protein
MNDPWSAPTIRHQWLVTFQARLLKGCVGTLLPLLGALYMLIPRVTHPVHHWPGIQESVVATLPTFVGKSCNVFD